MAKFSLEDIYPPRPKSQAEHLGAMDMAIHHNVFGHSSLSSHLAAPEYTTDPRACKILIDLLEKTFAWFDISKTDDMGLKNRSSFDWQVTICNMQEATAYGETMELAVCKACLLDHVIGSLRETAESLEKKDGKEKN
jgi:hypothetical protein